MTGIFGGFESALSYARGIDFLELSSVDLEEKDFMKRLPFIPAIYFILDDQGKPVYIGKAIRLQARWQNHHCLKRATKQKGMRLAWVGIIPAYLMMMESLFIMAFRPAWNQREYFEEGDYLFPDDPRRFEGYFEARG
jgi:hypothetical protein